MISFILHNLKREVLLISLYTLMMYVLSVCADTEIETQGDEVACLRSTSVSVKMGFESSFCMTRIMFRSAF